MKNKQHKIQVFSRHPSHSVLRRELPKLPFRSLLRLGSTTVPKNKYDVEINSIESIKISSNKKVMKEYFNKAKVSTAPWIYSNSLADIISFFENQEGFIVAKSFFGSRGVGNYLLKSIDEVKNWANGKILSNYIFEKYLPYKLEYRLHITKNGCFYACRKALKQDTPEEQRWRRHVDTSVWFKEENPNFLKPNSWKVIVEHCVRALNTIGADVLSFDVRVQSDKTSKGEKREFQDFILIECNSASSMNALVKNDISYCAQKYLEVIPELIKEKFNK